MGILDARNYPALSLIYCHLAYLVLKTKGFWRLNPLVRLLGVLFERCRPLSDDVSGRF